MINTIRNMSLNSLINSLDDFYLNSKELNLDWLGKEKQNQIQAMGQIAKIFINELEKMKGARKNDS